MMKIISAKVAGNILMIALGLLSVFHILVLIGIAPSDIIWGGQVGSSPENLLILEIIALVVTLLFAGIVAAKIGYLKAYKFRKAITVGVWFIFAYLLLNTVGNLASGVSFESLVFTPVTVLLTLCAFRLAIER